MSDLNELLPVIERLRKERDTLDRKAYALRSAILRANTALRRHRTDGPRRQAKEPDVIAAGRADIAALEGRLRTLSASAQAARDRLTRMDEAERQEEFLDRTLAARKAALPELQARLRDAERSRPPDRKAIGVIRDAVTGVEAQIADLERSRERLRDGAAERRADAASARAEVKEIAQESGTVRGTIDRKENEIGALRDASTADTARLEARVTELNAEYTNVKAQLKASRVNLSDRIKGIYDLDPHPRRAVAQMPDTTPFILLPVRIETRFVIRQSAAGPRGELLLRIYPDDIAIHTHESDLTDREVTEGERYWQTIFAIETGTADDKARQKSETWKVFAALFGPSRSAWVARRTRPTNWGDPLTVASVDALVFPTHDLTRVAAWTRAPRTHVLPDRFVVRLYRGNQVTEVVLNPIPDELFVGPEPLDLVANDDQAEPDDAANSFVTVNGQITFGASFDWASNFNRAVDQGMGARIPLEGDAVQGFDKIVVLGVMASASASTGKSLFETLLANHHHSPKGLTLLAQGSATNNLDGQGSGYSINDSLDQTPEVSGVDAPLFDSTSDQDGRILADALGIAHESLHFVFNSDNTDSRDAVAMNRALYPGTLGYYFDTMLPVLPDEARDRLREFFVTHVTGRGPLSAIRVGDQPYGILLTSDFAAWSENPGAVFRRDPFPGVLHAVLARFDAIWQAMLPKLAFAGKPGVNAADALLNILGLQPTSVTFAQRVAYPTDYLKNLAEFQLEGREFDEMIDAAVKQLYVTNWLRTLGYEPPVASPPDKLQLLQLVYQHYTTGIDSANLVDGVPLSETAEIREFAPGKNYLDWLRDTSTLSQLSAQDFGGKPAPTALLYLMLRHALVLQLHKSTVDWLHARGYDAGATLAPRTFHNIRPNGDLSRWELMNAPVRAVGAGPAAGRLSIADYIMAPAVTFDETAYLGQVRQALDLLANLSTARLERCFVEHIDTCTYRLDAWQTGLFKTRLDAMRQDKDGRLGSYVGAYGWVEDVRPSASWTAAGDVPDGLRSPAGALLREYAGNGGFIHAPSINHAMAAALLRSGYMSHATQAQPDVMAVNLSSERVRRALFILTGMRHGQSIEALLGYQFERGIHDRGSANPALAVLNGFLYDIRFAFPIERTRVGPGESGGAEETVPAYDVVNGLTLAEAENPDWAGITGAAPVILTAPRLAALNAEKDMLADTLDAVKDLLMAESAYQLVQGNFDRAGAVLTSVKDAHAPPDLDVIKTPRSSHFTFTQRVAVHFACLDGADPAANPWPAIGMSPRALLEPGINRWLGDVLGPPDDIVFTVFEEQDGEVLVNPASLSLADLQVQPIDLVYILGADINTGTGGRSGASELESRVAWRYRADNGLDETSRVRIQFGAPKGQAGTVTLAEAMPLVRALQTVLSESRTLDARDYHTTTTRGPDARGPAAIPAPGFDFDELLARTETFQIRLRDAVADVLALPFTANIGGFPVATLGEAFDVLAVVEQGLRDVPFTFAGADVLTLQQRLSHLAALGIADAFPRWQNVVTTEAKAGLVLQAMDAAAAARARLASAGTLIADAIVAASSEKDRAIALAIDACKAVVGNAFTVIPRFTLPNEADVLQSQGDNAELMDHAVGTLGMQLPEDEWIRGIARVRPRVAVLERARLLHETLFGGALDLTAIQLPYRAQDRWLAVALPDLDPVTGKPFDITHETLSMVIHGTSAFAPGSLKAGIVVDSWTETIPAREQATGIAFHYNRPDAMPPQAILLAVPPVVTGHWSWDALAGIVDDTLRRAKLRAVEPHLLDQHVSNDELGVLLPAIVSEFQQHDLNVSLDLRLNLEVLGRVLKEVYVNPNFSN